MGLQGLPLENIHTRLVRKRFWAQWKNYLKYLPFKTTQRLCIRFLKQEFPIKYTAPVHWIWAPFFENGAQTFWAQWKNWKIFFEIFSKIKVDLIRLSFGRSIEWCYSHRFTASSKNVSCVTYKNWVWSFFLITGRYLTIDFTYRINSTCA